MEQFNLKKLRIKNKLTQEEIAKIIGVKRNTYSFWENRTTLIPINKADELALYYNCSLEYLLGMCNDYVPCKLKPINYDILKKNLFELKAESRDTYSNLADSLQINYVSLYKYLKGQTKFKLDMLIKISKYFSVNIDELCGKK